MGSVRKDTCCDHQGYRCPLFSKELAAAGYLNERGKPYAAKSVASMLRRRVCRNIRIPSFKKPSQC